MCVCVCVCVYDMYLYSVVQCAISIHSVNVRAVLILSTLLYVFES